MPRTPLGEISANNRRGFDLTPSLRSRICGARDFGVGIAEIARRYEIPDSTVRSTLQQEPLRINDESLPRSGAPTKVSIYLETSILRYIRRVPKAQYKDIKRECNTSLSDSTLYRLLKKHGITNWLCKKRPFLSKQAAKARSTWVTERKDWTEEDWKTIIFSDECSLERGSSAAREWCFRTPNQKWEKDMIQTYKKGKDLSVMIWGAIWIGGRSDIAFMRRDETSKKNGYTALSYVELLDEHLPNCWEPGRIFMQDNAPIHKAGIVRRWFEDHGIPLLPWPPYSPDLNPIEHVWAMLKHYINEHYPELKRMGNSDADYKALCEAIEQAWNALDQDKIDHLIRGMSRRTLAVWKARGWHTKY
jgi:transposase